MIEKIVTDYLNDNLDVPTRMEHEEQPGETCVIIEKTGSGKRDLIHTATLAIQSYAPSFYEAAALNERVKEAMEGLITLTDIMHVGLNADYNYTDTTKSEYRYQAVFDITYL